jgi:hypothetical protein
VGIRYVKAANLAARAVGLDHAPTRLLMTMSATVLDHPGRHKEPPGRYFAGRIAMAMALGYGQHDPEDANTQAAHRAVDRSLRAIREANLLTVARMASNHRNAEYDLSPVLWFERHLLDRENSPMPVDKPA